MTHDEKPVKLRETLPLARAITRQYEGKWVVYSEDEARVIGVGETEEEAFQKAKASGVNGEWHVAYAFRSDEQIL